MPKRNPALKPSPCSAASKTVGALLKVKDASMLSIVDFRTALDDLIAVQ